MTDSDYVNFLINERSTALLHLIDAFQLTESELHDIYDGVFNRMKNYFHSGDRKSNEPVEEFGFFFDEDDNKTIPELIDDQTA